MAKKTEDHEQSLSPDPALIEQSLEGQNVFGFSEDTLIPDEDQATESVSGSRPMVEGTKAPEKDEKAPKTPSRAAKTPSDD
jgi:hypothetical protein